MIETEVDEYRLSSEISKHSLHISLISNELIYMIITNKLTNKRYSSYLPLQTLKLLSEAFSNANNIKEALTILKNTIESQNITLFVSTDDSSISVIFKIPLDYMKFQEFEVNLTLEKSTSNLLNTQNNNIISENINSNLNNNNTNQTFRQINLWTCPKCHQIMEENIKSDHILSHEIYEADRRLNNSHSLNNRRIENNNVGLIINENNSRNQIQYNNIYNNMNNIGHHSRPYHLNRNSNRNNYNNNINNINYRNNNNNQYFISNDNINYLNNNRNIYITRNNDNSYLNNNINRRGSQLNLPEFVIEDVNKLEEANRSCMICLDEFVSKEKVIALPCIHFFHPKCIKKWVVNKNECPICKFILTEENINKKLKYG